MVRLLSRSGAVGPARGLTVSVVGFTNPDGALTGRPFRRALHPPLEKTSHPAKEQWVPPES